MVTPPTGHVPVLAAEVLELLAPAVSGPDAVLVDATLGLGGHSAAFLARFPQLKIVGIDRDPDALAIAAQRLQPWQERVSFRRGAFADVLQTAIVPEPSGFLFDLGVSSMQIDSDSRGFAYARNTTLDMRMDPSQGQSAWDVVNGYDKKELTRVLRDYGDEPQAGKIAAAIVTARQVRPLETTTELAELVKQAKPLKRKPGKRGSHPAKQTFQAIRIEVNDELGQVRTGVAAALAQVQVGGRVAVMSYHSGEDKITKALFREAAEAKAPKGLPVIPTQDQPWLKLITRGAVQASADEITENPRATSVRLRVGEKTRQPEVRS